MYSPCFVFLLLVLCNKSYGELVNSKLDRNIDIASQLIKVLIKVTLENTGTSPVSTYLYALDPDTKPYLSYIGASQVQEEGRVNLKTEEITMTQNIHKGKDLYKISLKTPLPAGKTTIVGLELVFTHALTPYPSSISQSDKQLVMYHGNHYYYSPYLTKTQTTVVTLPSSSTESFTKLKPVSQTENLITYGPYDNIGPYTMDRVDLSTREIMLKTDGVVEVLLVGVLLEAITKRLRDDSNWRKIDHLIFLEQCFSGRLDKSTPS